LPVIWEIKWTQHRVSCLLNNCRKHRFKMYLSACSLYPSL
jgi:hypothetical protein